MPIKPYRYAILEAVANEMRKNKEMCYFWEYQSPVGTLASGTILNLWKEFGDVRTSAQGWPLDETWYVGVTTGLGSAGVPVVMELPGMTSVFCFEYVFNQIANFRMMTGGQAAMPIVIWQDAPSRAGGSAQQHTQVGIEAYYAPIPGLKIVIPNDAYQAAGLMTAAIRDPDHAARRAGCAVYLPDRTGDCQAARKGYHPHRVGACHRGRRQGAAGSHQVQH
jgi:pyruvate/2-oxoglutarate/acetoin dehydrogenase E1 component